MSPSPAKRGLSNLTPEQFCKLCEPLGTQKAIADILGVRRQTVNEWQTGKKPITKITEFAVRYAVHKRGKV